jgi:hypothetical protein
LAEHAHKMPDYRDLSQAHRVIFKTMEAMKISLAEYTVFHHRPFMVKHSDENKRYVLTCHHGCPWTVRGRKGKDCSWRITSVV